METKRPTAGGLLEKRSGREIPFRKGASGSMKKREALAETKAAKVTRAMRAANIKTRLFRHP